MVNLASLAASSGLLGASAPSLTPTNPPAAVGANGKSSVFGLGKDDFFKLFLAQLKNQDPTKPMDDSTMMSQLATFTMIETLNQVKAALSGNSLASEAGLIGKYVTGADAKGAQLNGIVDSIQQTSSGLVLMVGGRLLPATAVTSVAAKSPLGVGAP